MDTIFFSYSRVDSAFVLKLAKDLREAGINIWLDQLDIAPGSHWDASIEKALHNSKTLLIVLSPHSVASENVMDEVSYALEEGKRVIPILLSNCETPFRLRRLQRIDFTGDYRTGFNYLLDTLGSKEKKIEPVITETQTSKLAPAYKVSELNSIKEPPKATSKKYYFIGGAVLVLALAVWLITKTGKKEEVSDITNIAAAETNIVTVDTTRYYLFESAADSMLFLGIANSSLEEDASVVAIEANDSTENNNLAINLRGDSTYCFIFKHSRKFMTVYDDHSIGQKTLDPENAFYYELLSTDDGFVQIRDLTSDAGNVLGLGPSSEGAADGQKVFSVKNNSSLQTKWKLITIPQIE